MIAIPLQKPVHFGAAEKRVKADSNWMRENQGQWVALPEGFSWAVPLDERLSHVKRDSRSPFEVIGGFGQVPIRVSTHKSLELAKAQAEKVCGSFTIFVYNHRSKRTWGLQPFPQKGSGKSTQA